jgi:type VI secretion system secreted protein VgrG
LRRVIEDASFHLASEAFAADQLRVTSFRGVERIGRLFELDIEAVLSAAEGEILASLRPEEVVGAEASFTIGGGSGEPRRFEGTIARLHAVLDAGLHHRTYRLPLVPLAHRLALVTTQDIFQDLTIPQILAKKLELVGLGGGLSRLSLNRSYAAREYVVQYGETDLAFICRLAEHDGISLFFESHADGTRLVLTDDESGFPWTGEGQVPYHDRQERGGVHAVTMDTRLVPETHVVYDYNYRNPQVDLRGQAGATEPSFGGVAEYGSHIKTPGEAAELATIRAEESRGTQTVIAGTSDLPVLAAGARTRLDGHPTLGEDPLLVVEVVHEGSHPLESDISPGPSYSNRFVAVPGGFTYRPPRITPRPRIHGVLGAIVEGVEGVSSVHAKLDGEGRYTVRFLFDAGQEDARYASRPVRMAQPHAGAGYGMHFPLQVGTEVLVAFVDGDPDRPIIVGAVPNALTPSPIGAGPPHHTMLRTRAGVRLHINDGTPRGRE